MIELTGKFNTAKVFTDIVDEAAISQIITLLNQEFIAGSKVRIMPDVHAGAGCTIGTTMTVADKTVPNLVGVDIGCGVLTVPIYTEPKLDLTKLDRVIREYIPSGFNIHEKVQFEHHQLEALRAPVDIERANRSVGTLGGGNHFIEIDEDTRGYRYLLIHSGSRHLGLEIAKYYQEEAIKQLRNGNAREIIDRLRAQGRLTEIEAAVQKVKAKGNGVPSELAYVSEQLFDDYIHDMKIAQNFARINREVIMWEIMIHLPIATGSTFHTVHNYIDTENLILRKGAVSAQKGEKLIIPINMRDGSLLCVGKGNPDWNYSAPHGAGRLFSRAKAKEVFSVDDFAAEMKGVFTTSVGQATLDECPMAYKRMEDIAGNIGDTVEVVERLLPIYNFKAG